MITIPLTHSLLLVCGIVVSNAWLAPSKICGNSLFVSRRQRRQTRPCLSKSKSKSQSKSQSKSPVYSSSFRTTTLMISEQQLGTFEVIEMTESPSERKVALLDYTKDTASSSSSLSSSSLIDFDTAWDYQKQILNEQLERLATISSDSKHGNNDDDNENISSFLPTMDDDDDDDDLDKIKNIGHRDTIIMLQHHPVYTLGTGSDDKFVKSLSSSSNNNDDDDGKSDNYIPSVPVIRMDRGGEVTYHGPGQITVYPILDLRSYRQDIHWYMRALEEAIILAISKCGGGNNSNNNNGNNNDNSLRAERQDGVTGVWIDNHKVAAVGIKCRRWITMHGLAVNVEQSSLSNFQGIVPCGLEGRKVGCINQSISHRKRRRAHDGS